MIFTKDNNGVYNLFNNTKHKNIEINASKILSAINNCELRFKGVSGVEDEVTVKTQLMTNAFKDLDPVLTRGVAETGNFTKAQEQLRRNVNASKNSVKLFSGVMTKLKGLAATVGASLVNFGISLAINLAFTKIVKSINAANEAMEKASDEVEQLSEQSKSLSDTQKQVLELRNKLADSNTTENEAISIREQLYKIQNDLIEQYGAEAKQIDLVRDSINSLNDAFENLDNNSLQDWYSENAEEAGKAVTSIYGENSIATLFGVAGANIPNSGNEHIEISKDIDSKDLLSLTQLFSEQIGEENWTKTSPEGLYGGTYLLKVGKSIKDTGGTKKDLIKKYEEIIKELQEIQTNAQNEGRDITEIQDVISQFSKAKNYWADDNYENELATAKEYAKYLVSQDVNQNKAYVALQKAKSDYDTALVSDSEEAIKSAYKNYDLARSTIKEQIEGLGKTGNDGAVRDFLQEVVDEANADLAKEDFKLNFEANKDNLETSLKTAISDFGSGKAVNADEIINFNQYAERNKGTDIAKAFNIIESSANDAGVSLETYVNWLVEIGLVQGEISEESSSLNFVDILDMNTESMEAVSKELDNIQSSFSAIQDVISDYNTLGYLSIDNMQKLLALDSEYIKTLFDENGNLILNEQAYQDLAKAKLENIKMDMLRNAIDNIKQITDEASAQEYLSQKINDTTEATEGYTEAILKAYVANGVTQGGKVKEAVLDIYKTYKQYATLMENTNITFKDNTNTTETQTKALEKQKEALENVKEEQEAVKDGLEQQKSALEDLTDEYEDSQGKINDLIDLTVDMLTQKYEDEKEIIEKEKDVYKEKVDALKDALDEEKDAYDKAQSISEKRNDISILQRQAASLKGNNSVEGKQRLTEIESKLAESTQDLYDIQYENSISDRQNILDQEYERKEQLWNREIERIDEVVSNERQLRIQAMNLIDTRSNEFYNDLWEYVYQYTTKSKFEFNNLWNEAYFALDKYNWGQLTCMQIMGFLEQNIYNTGLQIDILGVHINDVSTAIDGTSTAIDNVSNSIDTLKTNLENATIAKTNFNTAFDGVVSDNEPSSIEIPLGGGKVYSTTGQSRLQSAITIWRKWKQDYDNGQTDRTTYSTQDIYKAILKKYPENQYASGTLSSKGGLSIVDEEGGEFILNQPSKGRYVNLNEGSVVFTKDQTENLWELSKYSTPSKSFMDMYDKFKNVFVSNGSNFLVNKSYESCMSDIKGNSSINTNSVRNNSNQNIAAPISVTVNNANGLNEKKLAIEIKNDIFREFRKYISWNG